MALRSERKAVKQSGGSMVGMVVAVAWLALAIALVICSVASKRNEDAKVREMRQGAMVVEH